MGSWGGDAVVRSAGVDASCVSQLVTQACVAMGRVTRLSQVTGVCCTHARDLTLEHTPVCLPDCPGTRLSSDALDGQLERRCGGSIGGRERELCARRCSRGTMATEGC